MDEIDNIKRRRDKGYTMAIYGSREAIHEQMSDDIEYLLELVRISSGYLPKCTRVEVIDKNGRAYTNYNCKFVETQSQDEGKTLKVFICQ